jgi:hypothetical protein
MKKNNYATFSILDLKFNDLDLMITLFFHLILKYKNDESIFNWDLKLFNLLAKFFENYFIVINQQEYLYNFIYFLIQLNNYWCLNLQVH